jgi:hypothetical protein
VSVKHGNWHRPDGRWIYRIDQVRQMQTEGGTMFTLTFRPIALESNSLHLAATVTEDVYNTLGSHADDWTVEEVGSLEYPSRAPALV